jgi:diguanylate cyclase (GGDEF)-like protein
VRTPGAGAQARGARSGNRPSILMMDLDGFKMMNDTLGHLQGDATLQAVLRTVTELLRSTDVRPGAKASSNPRA